MLLHLHTLFLQLMFLGHRCLQSPLILHPPIELSHLTCACAAPSPASKAAEEFAVARCLPAAVKTPTPSTRVRGSANSASTKR